jgi:hypothetical protein
VETKHPAKTPNPFSKDCPRSAFPRVIGSSMLKLKMKREFEGMKRRF